MKKLYKTIDGVRHYCEAWESSGQVTLHEGVVGGMGQVTTRRKGPGRTAKQGVEDALADARKEGYAELHEHELLVVQFETQAGGGDVDVETRHEIQLLINECLGWTGNGRCTGGDIVRASINLYAEAIDAAAAAKSIADALEANPPPGRGSIALEEGEGYRVVWPPDSPDAFTLPDAEELLSTGTVAKRDCHPDTRALLADDFFWDVCDDHSPHGSDDGADLLSLFLEAEPASRRNPEGFLHGVFVGFGFKWPVSTSTDEQQLKRVLAKDPYCIRTFDGCAIALAFAQLKVLGACDPDLQALAQRAVKRQSLPLLLQDWSNPDARTATLARISAVLQRAPLAVPTAGTITRLELTDETSAKFWEVEVTGTSVVRRWGKLGTKGRVKREAYRSTAAAHTAARELIDSKTSKGYREAGSEPASDEAPPEPAAKKKG
ncbi:MAG: WGR domain-containing protein [Planctomycetes bacterium]|nr:WGR domain-containing protein [Planctomycetota bacterium]